MSEAGLAGAARSGSSAARQSWAPWKDPNQTPHVQIVDGTKRCGDFVAVDNVSLDIYKREFFSLLGPSGCGKTTLLRQIGGFDDPTSGAIRIDGQNMTGVPANRRPTNMVFQNYAIFPHLTVAQNVAYGLRKLRLERQERERRVKEALAQVDMAHLGARRSNEISGGQRQRVALARALIMRPKVLLLDEPLSALDKKLREQMQVELRHLQRQVGITFILVTHDQEEALPMSDRIAVMFGGKIAQCDRPEEIYQHPRSRVVAEFIGGMNFLQAAMLRESVDGIEGVGAGFGRAEVRKPAGVTYNGSTLANGGLTIGARPERMTLVFDGDAGHNRVVEGNVVEASYYGDMP